MIWIIAVALVMNGAGQAIIDVDVDVDEGRPSHHHLSLAVRGEVGWRGPQVIAFVIVAKHTGAETA